MWHTMKKPMREQITVRVPDELHRKIEEIAERERRKPTEIIRALLERGVLAYDRDGHLFEPPPKPKKK